MMLKTLGKIPGQQNDFDMVTAMLEEAGSRLDRLSGAEGRMGAQQKEMMDAVKEGIGRLQGIFQQCADTDKSDGPGRDAKVQAAMDAGDVGSLPFTEAWLEGIDSLFHTEKQEARVVHAENKYPDSSVRDRRSQMLAEMLQGIEAGVPSEEDTFEPI